MPESPPTELAHLLGLQTSTFAKAIMEDVNSQKFTRDYPYIIALGVQHLGFCSYKRLLICLYDFFIKYEFQISTTRYKKRPLAENECRFSSCLFSQDRSRPIRFRFVLQNVTVHNDLSKKQFLF